MQADSSLDSFRSSLDANHTWPCTFPFKFIVPKKQIATFLELFANDLKKERSSSTGKYVAYTVEIQVHSANEIIAIYQKASQIPDIISL